MRYLYFILLVSFSTILFSKDNIPKAEKIKLNAPVEVDKSKESDKERKFSKDEVKNKRKNNQKKRRPNPIQSSEKKTDRKDKIDIHNDDLIFEDKSKRPKRSPELQLLLDELRVEANKEIKTLRKKYRDNLQSIKEDYKLRRDEIVKKFRNKRKK